MSNTDDPGCCCSSPLAAAPYTSKSTAALSAAASSNAPACLVLLTVAAAVAAAIVYAVSPPPTSKGHRSLVSCFFNCRPSLPHPLFTAAIGALSRCCCPMLLLLCRPTSRGTTAPSAAASRDAPAWPVLCLLHDQRGLIVVSQ